jgi:hypothetical protein
VVYWSFDLAAIPDVDVTSVTVNGKPALVEFIEASGANIQPPEPAIRLRRFARKSRRACSRHQRPNIAAQKAAN